MLKTLLKMLLSQQFNLGVDSSNVATRNRAIDEMRMDEAA
jgi:hypothetical protein